MSRERIQAWVNQNQSGLQTIHPHLKVSSINESQFWYQEGETILSLTLSAVKSENKKFMFALLRSHSVETHIAQFTTALSKRAGKISLPVKNEWCGTSEKWVSHRVAALWLCCFWIVRVCVADPDSWNTDRPCYVTEWRAVLQNGHEKSIQAAADTQFLPFHQLNFSPLGKWFVE